MSDQIPFHIGARVVLVVEHQLTMVPEFGTVVRYNFHSAWIEWDGAAEGLEVEHEMDELYIPSIQELKDAAAAHAVGALHEAAVGNAQAARDERNALLAYAAEVRKQLAKAAAR